MKRRKIRYLNDGNLIVFRIPQELADSLRFSNIDVKAVCIQALYNAVARNEALEKEAQNGVWLVRPPGFEPGSSAWQADVLGQARLRPPRLN